VEEYTCLGLLTHTHTHLPPPSSPVERKTPFLMAFSKEEMMWVHSFSGTKLSVMICFYMCVYVCVCVCVYVVEYLWIKETHTHKHTHTHTHPYPINKMHPFRACVCVCEPSFGDAFIDDRKALLAGREAVCPCEGLGGFAWACVCVCMYVSVIFL
jgi:hypothetical protein